MICGAEKITYEELFDWIDYDPIFGKITYLNRKREARATSPDGYTMITVKNKMYYAQKLIWLYMTGFWPPKGLSVDHKNRNKKDNRLINLRLATHEQNTQNRTKSYWKEYKGITETVKANGFKSYRCALRVNGVDKFWGPFEDKEDAARSYDLAALKWHKEFASINFPKEDYKDLII